MEDKEMTDMNKISKEELENVSGGTAAQIAELRAFIKSHDPGYVINEDFDIVSWLANRLFFILLSPDA